MACSVLRAEANVEVRFWLERNVVVGSWRVRTVEVGILAKNDVQ